MRARSEYPTGDFFSRAPPSDYAEYSGYSGYSGLLAFERVHTSMTTVGTRLMRGIRGVDQSTQLAIFSLERPPQTTPSTRVTCLGYSGLLAFERVHTSMTAVGTRLMRGIRGVDQSTQLAIFSLERPPQNTPSTRVTRVTRVYSRSRAYFHSVLCCTSNASPCRPRGTQTRPSTRSCRRPRRCRRRSGSSSHGCLRRCSAATPTRSANSRAGYQQ